MANTQTAKILTSDRLKDLRQPLPKSWIEAAGILKGKKRVEALKYQKQVRKEWDRRLEKFSKSISG